MINDIELLHGWDNEENIVAIENVPNSNLVQKFIRKDGKLTSQYERISPFFLANTKEPNLLGNNKFNTRIDCKNFQELYEQKKKYRETFIPFADSQYLVQTGKTLFKGTTQTLNLFFDIEVVTHPDYEFPNPVRDYDKIIIIAVHTNNGEDYLLCLNDDGNTPKGDNVILYDTEAKLIEGFIALVRKIDPDVIANHNIFNFDLDYLRQRADKFSVPFALGRNGTEPKFYETSIKFGDRNRSYTNYKIYGRHIIDTMFLAEAADVTSRNMPSYGLKDLVIYLKKASETREYVEGSQISSIWFEDRERLLRYALDDVYEAEILYEHFSPAVYKQTQLVPMGYQEVFRYGTGNQIDYIMLRNYMKYSWSFSAPEKQRHIKGGYADVLKYGLIIEDLIYADVESLYPSLALALGIQPKRDELKLFQRLVTMMINQRFAIKADIAKYKKEGNYDLASKQKAYDGAIKIFLNTLSYGYLAWSFGAFNDYDEAERITNGGQDVVKLMIKCIQEDGAEVIKVDTDGLCCTVPEKYKGSYESEMEYIHTITARMPEGIRIGHDGRYRAMLAFDKKSYAMLNYDGDITVKGNTIRGRNVEPFAAVLIKQTIKELLDGDRSKCKNYYDNIYNKIKENKAEKEEIYSRSSLGNTLEDYINKKESGNNPIAQYELALSKPGKYQKGDVIYFYVKQKPYEAKIVRKKLVLRKKALANYESVDFLENYNYDYDVDHYLERLEKAAKKFLVVGEDLFKELFPTVEIKRSDLTKLNKLTGED
jgi:DNA polymerase elongation subunit (family B)